MPRSKTRAWATVTAALLGAAVLAACDADVPPPSYPLPGPTWALAAPQEPAPAPIRIYEVFREAPARTDPPPRRRDAVADVCRDGSVLECRARCDDGDGTACDRLADIYERGVRVPVDPDRAARLRQRACDDGAIPACARCAVDGACAGDPRQIARDLDRACRSCPFGGDISMNGEQRADCRACDALARSDPARASAALERVCDPARLADGASGDARDFTPYGACARLARIDPSRGEGAFERACGRGIVGACTFVAEPGHARSQAALTTALGVLCQAHPRSDACGRLKDLGANLAEP